MSNDPHTKIRLGYFLVKPETVKAIPFTEGKYPLKVKRRSWKISGNLFSIFLSEKDFKFLFSTYSNSIKLSSISLFSLWF